MSNATATRKRTRRNRKILKRGGTIRQTLVEYASAAGAKVDVEAGVIRGVKILGAESKNGRTYSPQALKDAARLYEGVPVYVDHPDQDNAVSDRSLGDKIGKLTNIQLREDGVYGDLMFLKSHPLADQIIEAAERMPEQLGLSHNADGELTREGDQTIVQRVIEVRSVDLVSNPATNAGLFESERKAAMPTVKDIAESVPKNTLGRSVLLEIIGDEGLGDIVADVPVDVEPEAPAADKVADALKAVAVEIVNDDSIDPAQTAEKVMAILVAKDDILAGLEPAPLDEDEHEGEDEEARKKRLEEEDHGNEDEEAKKKRLEEEEHEKKKKLEESYRRRRQPQLSKLQRDVQQLTEERDAARAENHARQLLESSRREVSGIRVKSLVALSADSDRKKLIESWPKKQVGTARPTSSAPAVLLEADGDDEKFETNQTKFVSLICR